LPQKKKAALYFTIPETGRRTWLERKKKKKTARSSERKRKKFQSPKRPAETQKMGLSEKNQGGLEKWTEDMGKSIQKKRILQTRGGEERPSATVRRPYKKGRNLPEKDK